MSVHSESVARLSRLRHIVGPTRFRVGITLLLLGIVGARLDWSSVVTRLRHADVQYVIAAVLVIVLALVIGAYRWRRLLIAADIHLGIPELGRVYAVSTFSGTFLPTTVGGDVTRALLVARRGPMLGRTAVTVIVDRVAGLIGLLGVAWIGVVVAPTSTPRGTLPFLAWVTAAFILGGAVAAAAILRDSPIARRLVPRRIAGLARDARHQIRDCLHQPRLLAVVVASSLAFQALVAAQIVFLARAIDVHVGFPTAAVAVALVTVATLAPISIGGFGVREGTYVAIFGAASISATDATLISLLTVVVLFVASLPGAYLLARRGLKPALSEAIEP
jgi:uncharacterized protein (TIRG00374 family)